MNPFLINYELKIIEVYAEEKFANTEDVIEGVIMKYKKETTVFQIEAQGKTSVYNIPYIENILFKNLSNSGRDLLLYVIYNLKKNEDFINLKLEKVCKECCFSRPTALKGLKDLQDNAILYKKSQSEYWVNPHYIFNGNRINYLQKNCMDCIKIVLKKDDTDN